MQLDASTTSQQQGLETELSCFKIIVSNSKLLFESYKITPTGLLTQSEAMTVTFKNKASFIEIASPSVVVARTKTSDNFKIS